MELFAFVLYENGSVVYKPACFVTDSKFEVISEKASEAMPKGMSDPRKITKIANDGSVFYLFRIIDANVDKVTEEVRICDIDINSLTDKMARQTFDLYRQVYHYELACFPLEGNSINFTLGSEKRFIHSMNFFPISMDSVLVYGVMLKKEFAV